MAREEFIPLTWEISDGYVGGSRPQKASIHVSDLEFCSDEQEVRSLVASVIQEVFENRCGPDWNKSEEDAVVEKWKELKASAEA